MTGNELIKQIRELSGEISNGETRGDLTFAGHEAWDKVTKLVSLANEAVDHLEMSYAACRGVERLRQQVAFLLQFTEGAEARSMIMLDESALDGIKCNICGDPVKDGCSCVRQDRDACSEAARKKDEDEKLWWVLVDGFGLPVEEVFAMSPDTRQKLARFAFRMRLRGMV
jgi:hypothetical protein